MGLHKELKSGLSYLRVASLCWICVIWDSLFSLESEKEARCNFFFFNTFHFILKVFENSVGLLVTKHSDSDDEMKVTFRDLDVNEITKLNCD